MAVGALSLFAPTLQRSRKVCCCILLLQVMLSPRYAGVESCGQQNVR